MANNETSSKTFQALFQLSRPLLEYNIIITIAKGDIGAINILKDAIEASKSLQISKLLLAIGPTTPLSLQLPVGTRILWATYTDRENQLNGPHLTIVPPNHLTDLSLGLEKLSKTRTGRIPLIAGDFLDNVLSVSSDPAGLYSFLCKLFTRIRTNGQTAILMVTDEMHDPRKTAILKRFADAVIEYRGIEEEGTYKFEARILDHMQNHYHVWEGSEGSDQSKIPIFAENRLPKIGRQHKPLRLETRRKLDGGPAGI